MMIAQPYPAVGQISSPYEQPAKDLNTYATLKAVGKNLTTINRCLIFLNFINAQPESLVLIISLARGFLYVHQQAVFGKVTALSRTAVDPRSPLLFMMYMGS